MPNLRGSEWLIIILLIVLLFGAKRLPDAARSIGRSLRIFKAETKGLAGDDAAAQAQGGSTQGAPAQGSPAQGSPAQNASAAPAQAEQVRELPAGNPAPAPQPGTTPATQQPQPPGHA